MVYSALYGTAKYGESYYSLIEHIIASDSNIKKTGTEVTINSNSYIKKDGYESSLASDSYIKKIDNEFSLDSNSHIKKIDNEKTLTSDSVINTSYSTTIDSDIFIKKSKEIYRYQKSKTKHKR